MTDAMELYNYSLLNSFGQSKFSGMSANMKFIDKTFSKMVSDENAEQFFTDACHAILNDNDDTININMFNSVVFNLTNNNPQKLNMIVYGLLDNETLDFSKWIQSLLTKNEFSLQSFVDKHKDFYRRTQKLNYSIWYANNKNIRIGYNKKEYSNFNLMRSYLFYTNVINEQYMFDKQNMYYLYSIFSKCLEENMSIIDVLPLFKMFSYYKNMSYIPKENREELFNIELNDMFLTTIGSNQEFIKSMVAYIFKNIKEIKNGSLNDTVYNINKLPKQFNERGIYNLYFIKFTENFLLSPTVTSEQLIELKKLVNDFVKPDDNHVIQELLYKIEDVEDSIKNNTLYAKAHVTKNSDKYKDIKLDVNSLDRTIMNSTIIRYNAWSDAQNLDYEEFDISNTHNYIDLYITIYNSLYTHRYKYRNLQWNFNLGMSVVEIKLGGRKYQLQLTTPQMIVLCKFNHKSKFTANELAEEVNIKLSNLGPILNSFLIAKILKRSPGPTDDKNMYIYLDESFYSENDKISLISVMMSQLQKGTTGRNVDGVIDKKVTDEFAIGREHILEACVVRTMKQHKELTHLNLFEKVNGNVPFELDEQMFDKSIKTLIKKEYITSVCDEEVTYYYCDTVVEDNKSHNCTNNSESCEEDSVDNYESSDNSEDNSDSD